jgi:hypothetical protein
VPTRFHGVVAMLVAEKEPWKWILYSLRGPAAVCSQPLARLKDDNFGYRGLGIGCDLLRLIEETSVGVIVLGHILVVKFQHCLRRQGQGK